MTKRKKTDDVSVKVRRRGLLSEAIDYDGGTTLWRRKGRHFVLMTSSQKVAAQIYGDPDTFKKGDLAYYRKVRGVTGLSVLTEDGEAWKKLREIGRDVFKPVYVQRVLPPIVADKTNAMIDRWLKSGKPVDVEKEMRQLTLEVMARFAFTDDLPIEQAEEIADTVSRIMKSVQEPGNFYKAVKYTGLAWEPIKSFSREEKAAIDRVRGMLGDIVRRRRGLAEQPPDLLSRFLAAKDPETGNPLTDDQLVDNMTTMIIAGHETTATTLFFALKEIFNDRTGSPSLEQRMREDSKAWAKVIPSAVVSFNQAAASGALANHVFLEALRLHPSVPATPRYVAKDKKIVMESGTELLLKKGAHAWVDIQRSQEGASFGEDADQFRPDRFAEDGSLRHGILAFTSGPRQCLGRFVAETEGPEILRHLFSRLAFTNVQDKVTGKELGLTARPVGRLRVTPVVY